MKAFLAVVLLAACSKPAPSQVPEAAPGPVDAARPVDTAPPVDAAPLAVAPAQAPADAAPTAKKPRPRPNAAPAPAECKAGPRECCARDGTIRRVSCSAVPRDDEGNGPERGPGGWCRSCRKKCLPASARIATPGGEVAVSSLRAGDLVWTLDLAGARISAPVTRVRALSAPGHQVVRMTLADGRVVTASGGHPLADGRLLEQVVAGDRVEGTLVVGISTIPLGGDSTWDFLPAGPTGVYWADGVLLGSTL